MHALSYALEEALVSLRRNGRSAIMSLATIAIAFMTLGVSLASRIRGDRRTLGRSRRDVHLSCRGHGRGGQDALVADIQSNAAVSGVEHVSKDAALERFRRDFPDLADVANSVDNPFPSALEVRLRPTARRVTPPASWRQPSPNETVSPTCVTTGSGSNGLFWAIATVRLGRALYRRRADAGRRLHRGRGRPALAGGAARRGRHHAARRRALLLRARSLRREGLLLGGVGAAFALVVLWAAFVAWRGRIDEAVAALLPAAPRLPWRERCSSSCSPEWWWAPPAARWRRAAAEHRAALNGRSTAIRRRAHFMGFSVDTDECRFYTEIVSEFHERALEPYAAIPDSSLASVPSLPRHLCLLDH